jgi:hypothetical protein
MTSVRLEMRIKSMMTASKVLATTLTFLTAFLVILAGNLAD